MTSLHEAFAAIRKQHRIIPCSRSAVGEPHRYWALCEGCDWESEHLLDEAATQVARADLHAAHIGELQIAYLREHFDQHAEEFGLLREPFSGLAGPPVYTSPWGLWQPKGFVKWRSDESA